MEYASWTPFDLQSKNIWHFELKKTKQNMFWEEFVFFQMKTFHFWVPAPLLESCGGVAGSDLVKEWPR